MSKYGHIALNICHPYVTYPKSTKFAVDERAKLFFVGNRRSVGLNVDLNLLFNSYFICTIGSLADKKDV